MPWRFNNLNSYMLGHGRPYYDIHSYINIIYPYYEILNNGLPLLENSVFPFSYHQELLR